MQDLMVPPSSVSSGRPGVRNAQGTEVRLPQGPLPQGPPKKQERDAPSQQENGVFAPGTECNSGSHAPAATGSGVAQGANLLKAPLIVQEVVQGTPLYSGSPPMPEREAVPEAAAARATGGFRRKPSPTGWL